MAIPKGYVQQNTPTRALTEYTVGNPDTKVDLSTSASAPSVGSTQGNPSIFTAIGVDSQTISFLIPALAAGSVYTVSHLVPMPNIPANIVFTASDELYFIPITQVSVTATNAVLAACFASPQAFSHGITYPGPKLLTGIDYSSYEVQLTFRLYAFGATLPNQTVVVRIDAVLWNNPS